MSALNNIQSQNLVVRNGQPQAADRQTQDAPQPTPGDGRPERGGNSSALTQRVAEEGGRKQFLGAIAAGGILLGGPPAAPIDVIDSNTKGQLSTFISNLKTDITKFMRDNLNDLDSQRVEKTAISVELKRWDDIANDIRLESEKTNPDLNLIRLKFNDLKGRMEFAKTHISNELTRLNVPGDSRQRLTLLNHMDTFFISKIEGIDGWLLMLPPAPVKDHSPTGLHGHGHKTGKRVEVIKEVKLTGGTGQWIVRVNDGGTTSEHIGDLNPLEDEVTERSRWHEEDRNCDTYVVTQGTSRDVDIAPGYKKSDRTEIETESRDGKKGSEKTKKIPGGIDDTPSYIFNIPNKKQIVKQSPTERHYTVTEKESILVRSAA